jgi:hypothetical protein
LTTAMAVQALLKTPTAQLATNGGSQDPAKRRDGGHGPTLADQVEHELLPTPSVADGTGGHLSRSGDRSAELLLPGIAKSLTAPLLPTPAARDFRSGKSHIMDRNARPLNEVIETGLLPTPDGTKGGPNQRGSSGDLMLPSAVIDLLPTPRLPGDDTAPQSADGNTPSDAKRHVQLSLDEPGNG